LGTAAFDALGTPGGGFKSSARVHPRYNLLKAETPRPLYAFGPQSANFPKNARVQLKVDRRGRTENISSNKGLSPGEASAGSRVRVRSYSLRPKEGREKLFGEEGGGKNPSFPKKREQ